jgi:hypothetical protein
MTDPISTGRYKIVNVRFSNIAALPDENEGSPVSASVDSHNIKEFVGNLILVVCVDEIEQLTDFI